MVKKRIWFKTHNDDPKINPSGTSYKGCIKISYANLVAILGEPSKADGYKVDAQWTIRFKDKTIATIYNYKTGKNYLGAAGIPTVDIVDWNIGGATQKSVEKIRKLLGDVALDIRDDPLR